MGFQSFIGKINTVFCYIVTMTRHNNHYLNIPPSLCECFALLDIDTSYLLPFFHSQFFSLPLSNKLLAKISKIHSRAIHGCLYCLCVCSVVSDFLWPHGLYSTMFLFSWDSPGKNTGVGCHFLLQGILPTQGSSPRLLHLLHWQADSLLSHHLGIPQLSLLGSFNYSCFISAIPQKAVSSS